MSYQAPTVGTSVVSSPTTTHTNVQPGTPSGIVAGDLVLLALVFRATPSASPTVSGFTLLSTSGTNRSQLWGRIATGTDDTPAWSCTLALSGAAISQYARFPGAPSSITGISAATAVSGFSSTGWDIPTSALGTPSEDNCLIVYNGHSFDDDGPTTTFPNSSSVVGETEDATTSLWHVWSYTIQTTAANVGASSFACAGAGDQSKYSQVIALKAGTDSGNSLILPHRSGGGMIDLSGNFRG